MTADINKIITMVIVNRFESVEIVPQQKEYRDLLPKEWMEVSVDGKKEQALSGRS